MTDYMTLHNDAFVADLHCDTVMQMRRGYDISRRNDTRHIDIPRLQEGGVNLQVFACFVGFESPEEKCPAETEALLDTLDSEFARLSDTIAVCRTAGEAREIANSGRIAAFVGIENGMAINNDLSLLERYYERGVRYMTLIHNRSNGWCISANDSAPAFDGLTDFGVEVVRQMNELRMIVDVSHVHPLGVTQVLKTTTKPIIASHSCVHAICPHPRNLTDYQIKAIADNGGMIGINYHGDFISRRRWVASQAHLLTDKVRSVRLPLYYFGALDGKISPEEEEELKRCVAEWEKALRPVNPALSDVVDHIEYIVNLVGADYVGLGSDYDGIFLPPDGLDDTSYVPEITRELLERGHDERTIRKVLGENFLRVFAEVCG